MTSEQPLWIPSPEAVAGQPLTFRATGQDQDVTLIPLNQLFEERYAVYWRTRKTQG